MPKANKTKDTRRVTCPRCDMTGTPRGVKHHFTVVHAKGKPGRLLVTTQTFAVEVPVGAA